MLAVVLYHAGAAVPGGFVGVDVFFVISGYVIAGALVREWDERGRVDLRRFYLRRARRLLPAFAAMVGVVVLVGSALAPIGGQANLARTGLAASLFNANTYLSTLSEGYFERTIELNALLHTWSLSVEEQFYFVLPAAMIAAWRFGPRARGNGAVVVTVLALAGASGALMLWLTYLSGIGASAAFYLAPARAWEFLVGVLLVFARPALGRWPNPIATPLALVGTVAVVWSMTTIDAEAVFPGLITLVPVAGTALMIAAGDIHSEGIVNRSLGWRPFTVIGDLSYGWYLWHWPAIVFAAAWWPDSGRAPMIAAFASIGVAWLSYTWLEQPIRLAPRPTPRRTAQLAFGCVLSGVAVSGALLATTATLTAHDDIAGVGPHWPTVVGCDRGTPLTDLDAACRVGDGAVDVVIVGDSQASQLAAGVELGFGDEATIRVATFNACPFVDLRTDRFPEARHGERCAEFIEATVDQLVSTPADVVIVSSATSDWLTPERWLFDPVEERTLGDTADRRAAWDRATRRLVEPLVEAGSEVVLVHAAPRFDSWWPTACAVLKMVIDPDGCGLTRSLDDVEATRRDALEVERKLADDLGLVLVDPLWVACVDVCRTRSDQWLMRDGAHLSVAGSEALRLVWADLAGVDRSALRIVDDGS